MVGVELIEQVRETNAERLIREKIARCKWVAFDTSNGAPLSLFVPKVTPDFIPTLLDKGQIAPQNRFQITRRTSIYKDAGTGFENHYGALEPNDIKNQFDVLERTAHSMMVSQVGKHKVQQFIERPERQIDKALLFAGRDAFLATLAQARAARRGFELNNVYHMPDGTIKTIESEARRQRGHQCISYVLQAPKIIDWWADEAEPQLFGFYQKEDAKLAQSTCPITREFGGVDASREPGGRFQMLAQLGRFGHPAIYQAIKQFSAL